MAWGQTKIARLKINTNFGGRKLGQNVDFFKPCLLFEFTSKLNYLTTKMAPTYLPLPAAAVSQPVRTAVKLLIVHKMVWQPANHTARRPSRFNDIFLLSNHSISSMIWFLPKKCSPKSSLNTLVSQFLTHVQVFSWNKNNCFKTIC